MGLTRSTEEQLERIELGKAKESIRFNELKREYLVLAVLC